MLIGLGLPVAGAWAGPANITHFSRRAEELGYTSLWTFQRLLIGRDQQIESTYHSVYDPLIALGYAAAVTARARLGVAVVNLPFIAPAVLAKQAATLDQLSGGRIDLGLGTGWSAEEFTATGGSPERRGPRTREFVEVLRTLWADGVAEFAGEFYTIPPSRMDPKPVQRPGIPIFLGGSAETALKRAGRIADGWVSRSAHDLATIGPDIQLIRDAAAEAGRDPSTLRFASRGVVRLTDDRKPLTGRRRPLEGSFDQIREDLQGLEEQGLTEVFYDLNWDPLVGGADADPAAARDRATEIVETLAPNR